MSGSSRVIGRDAPTRGIDPTLYGWVYDEKTGAIAMVGFDEDTAELTEPVRDSDWTKMKVRK